MGQMYYKTSSGTLVPIGSYVINDTSKVSLTGTETISGAKTFSSGLTVSSGTTTLAGNLDVTSTNTKSIRTKNSTSFVTSKADGTDQEWMWPCWSDNKMYTNYGPSGWVIRNSSSTPVVNADNTGNFTFANNVTVSGTTTLSATSTLGGYSGDDLRVLALMSVR